jgi:hypothetical protein
MDKKTFFHSFQADAFHITLTQIFKGVRHDNYFGKVKESNGRSEVAFQASRGLFVSWRPPPKRVGLAFFNQLVHSVATDASRSYKSKLWYFMEQVPTERERGRNLMCLSKNINCKRIECQHILTLNCSLTIVWDYKLEI